MELVVTMFLLSRVLTIISNHIFLHARYTASSLLVSSVSRPSNLPVVMTYFTCALLITYSTCALLMKYSTCPLLMTYSTSSLLMTYSTCSLLMTHIKNVTCHFLMRITSSLSELACFKTSSLFFNYWGPYLQVSGLHKPEVNPIAPLPLSPRFLSPFHLLFIDSN